MDIRGQSILEYAVLIAILVATCATMTAYVHRGVRANLKSVEEQVNEELLRREGRERLARIEAQIEAQREASGTDRPRGAPIWWPWRDQQEELEERWYQQIRDRYNPGQDEDDDD